jgi:regulator of sirC expression with transglutaminase-like and TPR domain
LSYSVNAVIKEQLVRSFTHAALSPDPDLAVAALMIARIEYPKLDAGPYLDRIDAIGREAKRRIDLAAAATADAPPRVDPDDYARIMALNEYLFGELRFVGNHVAYEDPRNSFLNEVLDRRTGIPITLALVYMEVARRAGVQIEGVNFPGHFLMRCRARRGHPPTDDLIIDAFHGGALLSEQACREQLREQSGEEIDDDPPRLLRATKPQILARMLLNLKRLYVQMHSFPQAHDVTELLRAVDPTAINELRDRGLIAYQLKDFSRALRDLQDYLQLSGAASADEDERAEHAQIWEHVKTLRRRVASLN